MLFRKPCHMPFRKLIAPFTLTVLTLSSFLGTSKMHALYSYWDSKFYFTLSVHSVLDSLIVELWQYDTKTQSQFGIPDLLSEGRGSRLISLLCRNCDSGILACTEAPDRPLEPAGEPVYFLNLV